MKVLWVMASLVAILVTSSNTRPVRSWTYASLYDESDVVAIARVTKIESVSSLLEGYGDPQQYRGLRASAIVGLALKGSPPRTIQFDFFAYAMPGGSPPNGASFPDLSKAESSHYLVFLTKSAGGVLVPVGGHFDASASIRPIEAVDRVRIEDPTRD